MTLTSTLPCGVHVVACRLCKLAPNVEQTLADGAVQAVITFGGPPETTACLLFHVEGDMWIAAVGGNEGVYPEHSKEGVMRFAREVRARLLTTSCAMLRVLLA